MTQAFRATRLDSDPLVNARESVHHPNVRPEVDPTRRRRLRALWVSDVHLGARASKARELLDFLARGDR